MRLIHPAITVHLPVCYEKMIQTLANFTATCYNTELKNRFILELEEYLAKRIKAGHHSILEHFSISVTITCDRGISHELVRHRLCSFTQSSTRYINLASKLFEEHVTYIIPSWCKTIYPGIYDKQRAFHSIDQKWDECAEVLWFNQMLETESTYKKLIDKHCGGWRPEQARAVLPNSLATNIHMTANIREWRHILDLRAIGTTGEPHPQMKQIMLPLACVFRKKLGVLFDYSDTDLNITDEKFAYCNPENVIVEVTQ